MSDNNENTNEYKVIETPCTTVISEVESFNKQSFKELDVVTSGPVFAKLPVVLAEVNITIPLEATLTLDRIAMEIKRIKKSVFLTQSRIVPSSQDSHPGTGILFIKGFIRNTIEYVNQKLSVPISKNISGNIRYCIVEVPFDLSTRITFIREPIWDENNEANELDFSTGNLSSCDDCSDEIIGSNPCDDNFFSTEFFYEKPFTELVRADIIEVNINTNSSLNNTTPTEESVTSITEKSILNLTLTVLQRQQVRITAL
ncbi:CsxC family protein [Clostridium sp.]|uniref:CsxC family protein n=1 Tax=Clostridium sp. TaxID=1506 RepID=UPI0025C11EBD|nr:hypothetical protein [Clostridium sp.]